MILKIKELNEVWVANLKETHFPDGQNSVEIQDFINPDSKASIHCSLRNWIDLEKLVCLTQCLKEIGVQDIGLNIVYLIGARSDRKFMNGSTNYLKNVVAPVINSQNYRWVSVLDPHSDVTEAVINNFKKTTNHALVSAVLHGIDQDKYALVSPDAGALKKIYDVAKVVNYKGEIIVASKHRDVATGKITHTEVPVIDSCLKKDLYIIDDICDGGRTFVEIAKAARQNGYTGSIFLLVTHGIFSAGLEPLKEYFEQVYCTNSYKNIDDSFVIQIKVI